VRWHVSWNDVRYIHFMFACCCLISPPIILLLFAVIIIPVYIYKYNETYPHFQPWKRRLEEKHLPLTVGASIVFREPISGSSCFNTTINLTSSFTFIAIRRGRAWEERGGVLSWWCCKGKP